MTRWDIGPGPKNSHLSTYPPIHLSTVVRTPIARCATIPIPNSPTTIPTIATLNTRIE